MKVLIAVDGSAVSWHALEEALRTLRLGEAEVAVVHVVTTLSSTGAYAGIEAVAHETEARRAEGRAVLATACRMLKAGGVAARAIFQNGDPAHEILAVAEDLQPDVIVVGSHGHGPVRRLLLGSVSDALVHRWPGQVLVVRPRAPVLDAWEGDRPVREVMTGPPRVVAADQTLEEVAEVMRDARVGLVPVIADGRPIGVLTDRDLVVRAMAEHLAPEATAADVCSRPVVWVAPEMSIEEAIAQMERHRVRRLVVLDGDALVGVMSLDDLAGAVAGGAEHVLSALRAHREGGEARPKP